MNVFFKATIISICLIVLSSENIYAQTPRKFGRGRVAKKSPFSIGIGWSMDLFDQEGLNQAVNSARTTSSTNTGLLKVGYEYFGYISMKLPNNMFMAQVRPSYFTQSSSGVGVDGAYNYELKGYTAFGIFRMTPYNFNFMDLYAQAGLGYAKIDGHITNGSRYSNFNGSGFGTQVGIGSNLYFYSSHAFGLELNYRYLPIIRNLVTGSSAIAPDGIGQAINNRELENTIGNDISTNLTGIIGAITYTINF